MSSATSQVMADLHAQGRYDRMTDDLSQLTGVLEFVKLHAAEFTRPEIAVTV